jgi:SAM-dependent methyltransferase
MTEQGQPTSVVVQKAAPIDTFLPFEAMNVVGPDRLSVPRRIAAALVAQDNPAPNRIVDLGSFTGEFLEAFLVQFPGARGQWTDASDGNMDNAKARLARLGDRVDYVVGGAGRDISDGCVPAGSDVVMTSWASIHLDGSGVARFYRDAAALLPAGGWLINLDHVGFDGNAWDRRLNEARKSFHSPQEGPPLHHDHVVPTLTDHLQAFRAAGITDVEMVWRSFTTCLFMGRKG